MTCCRKGCGIAVVVLPVILMIMALLRQDWSFTEQHLIVQDKEARVSEDQVLISMGPFHTKQTIFQGEAPVIQEDTYKWCATTADLFSSSEQSFLCMLLTTSRAASILTVGLGAVLFAIYMVLISWSAKLTRFATTAKVAGGLHLLQTLAGLTAVGAWWYMSRAYMSTLTKHVPVFSAVSLPMGVGWYYAVFSTVLSLLCTVVLCVVSRRGVAARKKDEEIQRKIRDFKAKQQAEELKLEMAL